jgi:hypothetical protein
MAINGVPVKPPEPLGHSDASKYMAPAKLPPNDKAVTAQFNGPNQIGRARDCASAFAIAEELHAVFGDVQVLAHGAVHEASQGVAERNAFVQVSRAESDGFGILAAQVVRAGGGQVAESDDPGVWS